MNKKAEIIIYLGQYSLIEGSLTLLTCKEKKKVNLKHFFRINIILKNSYITQASTIMIYIICVNICSQRI